MAKSAELITLRERRKAGLVLVKIAPRDLIEEMQMVKQGNLSHNTSVHLCLVDG